MTAKSGKKVFTVQSAAIECAPGKRKVAVKVVDLFGNDTMTIVKVTV